jgi:putative ABC transport system permease protein
MLQNYLRTALRALKRRLGYAAINVTGLAVGLACCLLIGLYVRHELSYDRHHADAERIVRVASVFNDRDPVAVSPSIAGPLFTRTFSAVETSARLNPYKDAIVERGARSFREESGVMAADSTVFDVFTMPFVAGTPEDALSRPGTVVLTESAAERYFSGSSVDASNPVGASLTIDDTTYEVTGVVEDPPATSHLQYDALFSWASTSWADREIWGSANFYTYLKLSSPNARAEVEEKIAGLVQEKIGAMMEERGFDLSYALQPLTGIHLYANGNITYVYLFGAIALLILVVACINFVNLATARSGERAREVGVRKTLGAHRSRLVGQFLVESVVLALAAAVLALAAAEAALPAFEALSGRELAGAVSAQPGAVGSLLLGAVVTGLLAGAYPALVLSDYEPVSVLKGTFGGGPKRGWLRQGLVVVQFAVSMVLIVGTVVIYTQLDYVQSKNLGFDREHVAVLPLSGSLDERFATVQQEMSGVAGVEHVAAVSSIPGGRHGGYQATTEGMEGREQGITGIVASSGVVDAMGLELLTGDGLPASVPDSLQGRYPFVINETMAQRFGWTPQEAVGKPLSLHGREGHVRGVVKDFHVASLRQTIDPLVLFVESSPAPLDHALVRMRGASVRAAMEGVETAWARLAPDVPFTYRFLDDAYDALYRAEVRTGRVFGVIAGLAILVAILGLVGLAAYSVRRRMKEISIRKTLGATVPGIVRMFSMEVIALVGVAFLVAAPLAYLAAQQWLQRFAYATDVGPWPFLLAVAVTATLAAGTMAAQALRAARTNPAEVLQAEN